METKALIEMLNRDMADEHAAIIRYLVHSYLEGEDSPLGAGLLSRAREEMWHMNWLGMIVGKLGGEPEMAPAPYPYDPTNRETIFRSYVEYEKKLIQHYHDQADQVDDPHIKRVLHREGSESEMHANKFQRVLDKLTPEQAAGLPGEENELPEQLVEKLQDMVQRKYTQVLQSLRDAWVFQKEGMRGWQVMDFSMTNMKQLAHVSEEVAENGIEPRFQAGSLNLSAAIGTALKSILEDVRQTRKGHQALKENPEAQKHSGLMLNLDLSIAQEQYEAEEIEDWLKR
jgi:bacterioferritin